MTMYATPGETNRELVFDGFASGLTFPTIGARLLDNAGGTSISRGAVVERPTGSGRYVWTPSAMPSAEGDYGALCDDNNGTLVPGVYAGEDVVIRLPDSDGGGGLTGVTVVNAAGGGSVNESTFIIKRGDTDPSITITPTQPAIDPDTGLVILVSWVIPVGATCRFKMRAIGDFPGTDGGFALPPKVDAAAVIDSGLNTATYGWDDTDTDTAGQALAEFEFQWTGDDGTETRTFPVGLSQATNWILVNITKDDDE